MYSFRTKYNTRSNAAYEHTGFAGLPFLVQQISVEWRWGKQAVCYCDCGMRSAAWPWAGTHLSSQDTKQGLFEPVGSKLGTWALKEWALVKQQPLLFYMWFCLWSYCIFFNSLQMYRVTLRIQDTGRLDVEQDGVSLWNYDSWHPKIALLRLPWISADLPGIISVLAAIWKPGNIKTWKFNCPQGAI